MKKVNFMPKDRTVEDALEAAEFKREEILPYIVQCNPYDWDLVILANEVIRLRTAEKRRYDNERVSGETSLKAQRMSEAFRNRIQSIKDKA